jgi:uroporphyrinogen-III synthase
LKLLVTRAEPQGAQTAQALRARGHEVWLVPLTRIELLAPELGPGPWAAVLISSANAAAAVEIHPRCQELTALPVLAVGARSAGAARRAGFAHVTSAGGNARNLMQLAAARYRGTAQPLLYLAGADRAADLLADLAAAAVSVEMHVVYQAVATPNLPPDVAGALRAGALDAVLHFSRRSAEIYLQAAANAGLGAAALKPVHICLSARIAEPLVAAGAESVRIAERPTQASLLQCVESP